MALSREELKIEKVKCEEAIAACERGINLNTMMLEAVNHALDKLPEEEGDDK